MNNTGYISVFRSIMDKGWYKDSESVALWLHLLLKANHKGSEFMHGYEIIKLKSGQFVTGRKSLSFETGISESKIERILKLFEKEQQIEQQTNSRNRIITILSWDKYQKSEQQVNSRRTASEQPADTNNNDNNNNNVNNDNKQSDFDLFWDLYDKKIDKDKVVKKWASLKQPEKDEIFKHLPVYKISTPDKKYRKHPLTYLNKKSWTDEVILPKQSMNEIINPDKYNGQNKHGIKVL